MRPFILIVCLLCALVLGPLAAYRVGFDAGQASVVVPDSAASVDEGEQRGSSEVGEPASESYETPAERVVLTPGGKTPVVVDAGAGDPGIELVPVSLDRSDDALEPFTAEAQVVTIKEILEAVAGITDPNERRQKLRQWTATMDRAEVEDSLAELDELALSPMRNDAVFAVVSRLAQLDPKLALDYAASEVQPKLRYEMRG